jgi:hypothetical protein
MIHVHPCLRRGPRSVLDIQPIEMSGTRRRFIVVVAMVIFVSLIITMILFFFFLLPSLRQENNLLRIVLLLCILFRAIVNIDQLLSQLTDVRKIGRRKAIR